MSGSSNEITNTSGPGSSSEPSMEEILASIRRILKDEEVGTPAAPEEVADEEDEDVLLLDAGMVVPHFPEPAPPPEPSWAEPDSGFPAEPPQHLASELPDPDFPEAGNETFDLAASEMLPSFEAGTAQENTEPVVSTEPGVAGSVKEVLMTDDNQQQFEAPPGLVSESAREAAASSIGSLIRSISSERSIAIGRPGLTLEDLVREELRPLLKAWLDSNLPPLVERIVRAEIQRVIERTAT